MKFETATVPVSVSVFIPVSVPVSVPVLADFPFISTAM
jgi:hypothetical protein